MNNEKRGDNSWKFGELSLQMRFTKLEGGTHSMPPCE